MTGILLARQRVVTPGSGGGGGGGIPTLPSDQVVGQPAFKMIDWGGPDWIGQSSATYALWVSRGHAGWKRGFSTGFHWTLGGTDDFQGYDVSALSGTQYDQQKLLEGSSGSAQYSNDAGMESYLGFRLTDNHGITSGSLDDTIPPYGSWFSDANWTAAIAKWEDTAQAVQYMNMTGISLDTEYMSWSTEAGHTLAETQAQAKVRGYQWGTAVWTAKPDLVLLWYQFYPSWGYNQLINLGHATGSDTIHNYFLWGIFDAMRVLGATGQVCIFDAGFYRQINHPADGYKLNSQGPKAWYSNQFDQAVWNYCCDKFFISGFIWGDYAGNSGYYFDTKPTDAEWSQWTLDSRNYSEGIRRGEYNYRSPGGYSNWAGGIPGYATATRIAGAQAAASETPISTIVPAITSLAAVAASGTVTITCNAKHLYGIQQVKVYSGATFNQTNPAASYLGAMLMTWNQNGRTYNTGYTPGGVVTDYMACTFATPGAAGDYFVVACTSIKGDVKWALIQST